MQPPLLRRPPRLNVEAFREGQHSFRKCLIIIGFGKRYGSRWRQTRGHCGLIHKPPGIAAFRNSCITSTMPTFFDIEFVGQDKMFKVLSVTYKFSHPRRLKYLQSLARLIFISPHLFQCTEGIHFSSSLQI